MNYEQFHSKQIPSTWQVPQLDQDVPVELVDEQNLYLKLGSVIDTREFFFHPNGVPYIRRQIDLVSGEPMIDYLGETTTRFSWFYGSFLGAFYLNGKDIGMFNYFMDGDLNLVSLNLNVPSPS